MEDVVAIGAGADWLVSSAEPLVSSGWFAVVSKVDGTGGARGAGGAGGSDCTGVSDSAGVSDGTGGSEGAGGAGDGSG